MWASVLPEGNLNCCRDVPKEAIASAKLASPRANAIRDFLQKGARTGAKDAERLKADRSEVYAISKFSVFALLKILGRLCDVVGRR